VRPKLSIVVPILDEEAVLPSLINKLKDCQGSAGFPIECVFVDGGSSDRSTALCEAADFPVVRSERGRGQQLHEGALQSQGDILLFLHADSHVTPKHCQLAVQSVQDNGLMAGGFRLRFDDKHPILKLAEWINLIRFRFTRVLYGDHGVFIRRDKYQAVGGFPAQALFEDIEFSKRLKKLGRVVMLSQPLQTSARRFRAGGVLRTYLLMATLHILYWLKVSPEKLSNLYGRNRHGVPL
jgi:rSAM/selenodomain-associated transferase 2